VDLSFLNKILPAVKEANMTNDASLCEFALDVLRTVADIKGEDAAAGLVFASGLDFKSFLPDDLQVASYQCAVCLARGRGEVVYVCECVGVRACVCEREG
jgi:hypothetical protein